MGSLTFAARMAWARASLQAKSCPYCGHDKSVLIGRKKMLIDLLRCENCELQFRYPKDSLEHNARYYQSTYLQWTPDKARSFHRASNPTALVDDAFEQDRQRRVDLARAVKETGRVLDYGCSWGLGASLLQKAGFEVCGFEVSRPRAEIAQQRYGLEVITEQAVLEAMPAASFDLIYSSHVLEHLPDIGGTLRLFRRLIKDDGAAVVFVPNGGGEKARRLGVNWGALISKEHCLALDAAFFAGALPEIGFRALFRSDPYQEAATPDPDDNLAGDELMVIATPK